MQAVKTKEIQPTVSLICRVSTEINKSGNEVGLSFIVYRYINEGTKLKQARHFSQSCLGFFNPSSCTSLVLSPCAQGLG